MVTALGVVICRAPLYSALCLAGTLLSTAALFLNLQAHLAAGLQVMVYAGAILVLIVFTIMLLNLRTDTPAETQKPLAVAAGMTFAAALLSALLGWLATRSAPPAEVSADFGTAAGVGRTLMDPKGPFVYPFEIVSILLLCAVIGAVALGKKRA